MSRLRLGIGYVGFALFGIGWGRLVVHWYPPEFVFAKELTLAISGSLLLLLVIFWGKIFREKEEKVD